LRVAHGANSSKVKNALAVSPSTDPEYMKKVIAESTAKEEEAEVARR